jgi:hypothetical protein
VQPTHGAKRRTEGSGKSLPPNGHGKTKGARKHPSGPDMAALPPAYSGRHGWMSVLYQGLNAIASLALFSHNRDSRVFAGTA